MTTSRDIKLIEAILFASGQPVEEDDLINKIVNKNEFNNYMLDIRDSFNKY